MEPPQSIATTNGSTTPIPVSLKLITCSFAQMLAIILEQEENSLGYRYPRALVNASVGKQLKEADPEETYIHVCLPNTELNSHKTKYLIWERSDWNTSYDKFLREKEESRLRVEKWEYRKAKIAELTESMADMLGINLEATNPLEEPIRELLKQRAAAAVESNNATLAQQFGVTL